MKKLFIAMGLSLSAMATSAVAEPVDSNGCTSQERLIFRSNPALCSDVFVRYNYMKRYRKCDVRALCGYSDADYGTDRLRPRCGVNMRTGRVYCPRYGNN